MERSVGLSGLGGLPLHLSHFDAQRHRSFSASRPFPGLASSFAAGVLVGCMPFGPFAMPSRIRPSTGQRSVWDRFARPTFIRTLSDGSGLMDVPPPPKTGSQGRMDSEARMASPTGLLPVWVGNSHPPSRAFHIPALPPSLSGSGPGVDERRPRRLGTPLARNGTRAHAHEHTHASTPEDDSPSSVCHSGPRRVIQLRSAAQAPPCHL